MSRRRFVALSLVLDALLVNVGFVAAFIARFGGTLPEFNFAPYIALAPLITVVYLLAAWANGLYEPERSDTGWEIGRAAMLAATVGAVMTAAISFFGGTRFFSFSRLVILFAWGTTTALLVGWRLAALRLTPIRWPEQRILVVGVSPLARELARELAERSRWGFRVVGFVARDEAEAAAAGDSMGGARESAPLLGTIAQLSDLVAQHGIHRIMVASPVAVRELMEEVALSKEADVRVDVVPELYEILMGRVDAVVSDIPLMQLTPEPPPSWVRAAKRTLDIVLAAVTLVVLSPVMLLFAIISLLSMGRPVFFTQERVGRGMKPFRVAKFRTMVRDAERLSGPVLATDDDPRITPLGRIMRTYRIDELPQLVNIIAGTMSFVGPRPERAFFVDQYIAEIPGYAERFEVKPGVTGLAQVNGGYATTAERKLKYDLIYLYHQSLLMDFQILAETVRVILTGHGAR